ncbi:MAG: cation:H+ antiporter [Natronomonas sp.]|uniref:sodium:calcium antiporter n=1 Tax=Natronomonas sp. TaxID=2184060 RepID=UPI0039891B3A
MNNPVLVDLASLMVGVLLLVYGSERTVEAVSSAAYRHGVSTFFVGVTVVAIGSSIPEIATSIYGSLYGTGDFVVAHIIGSATSQITLGIGVIAFATSLTIPKSKVRRYGGSMLVAMTVMLAVVWFGRLGRLEGTLMVAGYLGFLAVRFERDEYHGVIEQRVDASASPVRLTVRILLAVAMVVVGGHLLVTGAAGVAASLGAPWYLLGIVTGLGTTIPEISVAISSVYHHERPIAVGTLLGSNITDPLFSLGIGAALGGLTIVDPRPAILGTAYMLLASVVVLLVAYQRERFGYAEGVVCVVLYLPSFLFG